MASYDAFAVACGSGVCHKAGMRLRDFASVCAILSDQEIVHLQAAVDERREARLRRLWEAEMEAVEAVCVPAWALTGEAMALLVAVLAGAAVVALVLLPDGSRPQQRVR